MVLHTLLAIITSTIFTANNPPMPPGHLQRVCRTRAAMTDNSPTAWQSSTALEGLLYGQFFLGMEAAAA